MRGGSSIAPPSGVRARPPGPRAPGPQPRRPSRTETQPSTSHPFSRPIVSGPQNGAPAYPIQTAAPPVRRRGTPMTQTLRPTTGTDEQEQVVCVRQAIGRPSPRRGWAMAWSLARDSLGRPPPRFEPVIERLHRRLLLCCDHDATIMLGPRQRLRAAARARCAGLVPGVKATVIDPRPEFFLPWKNRLFYDGPGTSVTDRARSGNYYMCGRV
jgi:hypothetical protein